MPQLSAHCKKTEWFDVLVPYQLIQVVLEYWPRVYSDGTKTAFVCLFACGLTALSAQIGHIAP